MYESPEYTWQVTEVRPETRNVVSLFLEPTSERSPSYVAGQYLTVKLPGQAPAEGKSYSLASAPQEDRLQLTVREIGDYSRALMAHQVGDTMTTSAPYGFFYPEPEDTAPLVFIVGGIGITPCFSIIKDQLTRQTGRPLHLFYSNQTAVDIVFREALDALAAPGSLTISYHITREVPTDPALTAGRMTPASIRAALPDPSASEFFICGSMDFTKALWQGLRDEGLNPFQLYTEGFF